VLAYGISHNLKVIVAAAEAPASALAFTLEEFAFNRTVQEDLAKVVKNRVEEEKRKMKERSGKMRKRSGTNKEEDEGAEW
jgi:ADP-ribosylglycohydrolase